MPKIVGTFCEERRVEKSKLDRRSFRWKQSGKTWLLVACPRGQWQPRLERCAAGMKAYAILRPAKRGRCKVGKRIAK